MKIRKPKNGEHRCTQVQCAYYLKGQCLSCEEEDCGSPPFIISNSCTRCDSCENIPNELRFGVKKLKEKNSAMTLTEEEKLALSVLTKGMERRKEILEKELEQEHNPIIIK